jgi:predicted ATPase/DNA-binding SARP family transcriptional activator
VVPGGGLVPGVPVFEVRLLGPVQAARAGREVPLGGPRQRAVLALLVLEAGRVVPAGRLAEELWRGAAPPGAAVTVRSYVSRLRSALAPEVAVAARGGGYAISAGPDQLDASRFERLVAAGHDALAGGQAVAAGARFREALGLWRGPALADVLAVESLALEAARLEELRLAAVEARIEADLATGSHAEVTGELERLVAEHPLRERLWRLLMLGLYRGGRQADALAAYQRARVMLAQELGLEPGEDLRELEQAVLRHEVPPAAPDQRQHNLPARLTSFVGREEELAGVGKLLGQARLVTLTGPGGAGKTRLAVEFAAAMVGRFPDGVWLAELAGIGDPGLVGVQVMEALGVRQAGGVPVLEALAYRLRSADLLLVLDNCEHLLDACAGLASALLAGAPGLRVLATSREPLGVPGEAACPVPPLAIPPEGAEPADIAAAPAVRLFADRSSVARAGAEVLASSVAVIGRICRELDGLPLAIELAAARASALSVEEIEAHLTDKFRFLTYRRPVADARHQALKTAIDWSYHLLPAAEQRVLAQLSVFAGGFALAQAADVCCGGDRAAALDAVDQLVSKSLVLADTAGARTRYRMLEIIRQYAAGPLADTGQTEPARRRHAGAYLGLAEREPDFAVLSRELDNFRAALDWSLSHDSDLGPRLARALGGFWEARGLPVEGQAWLERALATGPADPWLRAELLRLLGTVLCYFGDLDRADAVLSEGSQVAAAAGLGTAQARIRVLLHRVQGQLGQSDAEALADCEVAAATLESGGDLAGLAEALVTIGIWRGGILGDTLAGVEDLERAVVLARASGNHPAELDAIAYLLAIYLVGPIPLDTAIGRAEQFLDQASADPWAKAELLQVLAGLYAQAGRIADARAAISRAQSAHNRSGAKINAAVALEMAGLIEMIAGDPAAAEQQLKQAYEAHRAAREHAWSLANVLPDLAEAVYAQGRLDEAEQATEEAQALAGAGDFDTQARWRATRAKILARRGQHAAATQLADEAEALAAPTSWTALQAQVLEAKAEVLRLAGATAEAETCLRTALDLHEQRRASALADRARAALARLLIQPG